MLSRPVERRHLRQALFSDEELDVLDTRRRAVDSTRRSVAYSSYEGPFARAGGLFEVATRYTRELAQRGTRVAVITPYHSRLKTAPKRGAFRLFRTMDVPFGGRFVRTELLEHEDAGGDLVRWAHIAAPGFFEAEGGPDGTDPYASSTPHRLLTDSLFACACLPYVLVALGYTSNVIVHLQDWEFAAGALTLKLALLSGMIESAATVLTVHNPYDHALPESALLQITDRVFRGAQGRTVYQCMLPLIDAPIATVSATFGIELTTEPPQTLHFAGHLQAIFRSCGVVGIDNGLFGDPERASFSDKAVLRARNGNPNGILLEKAKRRRRLLEALEGYEDSRILGHLEGLGGRPLGTLPDDIPVFLMFGRLDPAQKGFDLFSRAIEAMPRGLARFILTPVVAKSGPFLDDLAELARDRAGEVVVYPFRMAQGYAEAMAGATYAVMPSLYEPFGAATEAYLAGTPVIARATGGLGQQVTDPLSGAGTGFLFRESSSFAAEEWRDLLRASTPEARSTLPLYGSMVAALGVAIARAACLYSSCPSAYADLLVNLQDQARRFSWAKAAHAYEELYTLAVS